MSVAKLTIEDAREKLRFCNSYTRMEALIALAPVMANSDWLRVLGEEWTGCDNIAQYRRQLRRMLPSQGPAIEMMEPSELEAFSALPEKITVYRGCGPHNMLGASWSLDRAVAVRFVTLHRYRVERPLLVTAIVAKSRVVAVKLDREESEVITFAARRVRVEAANVEGLQS